MDKNYIYISFTNFSCICCYIQKEYLYTMISIINTLSAYAISFFAIIVIIIIIIIIYDVTIFDIIIIILLINNQFK